MAERLPSDHDDVATHRARLSRVGRTDRVQVELPDAVAAPVDEPVRVALDGTDYHGLIERDLDGDRVLRRVRDNARLAREGDGEDRLGEWADAAGVGPGESVAFDVVTPEYAYGVRTPGERVVYDATEPPSDSLSDIASDLG